MNKSKKRIVFRPSAFEAQLEERLVLSSATRRGCIDRECSGPAPPLAAAPPIYSPLVISSAAPWRTVGQLRHAYTRQVKLAALDLRNAVATDIQQLYANTNGDPTSQQMANLTASVEGAVDATALQLSSEASLLPASSNRLVPAIQKSLLGSGSTSLATTLNSILQSAGNTTTAQHLQQALGRVIAMVPSQLVGQFGNYFNTTSVNQLSVNSSGQQIPASGVHGQSTHQPTWQHVGIAGRKLPECGRFGALSQWRGGRYLKPGCISGTHEPVQHHGLKCARDRGDASSAAISRSSVAIQVSPASLIHCSSV